MSKILIGYRLCVFASGSLITDILNCLMLIIVSCLHFGQNSGKFFNSVSSRIFSLVLFPHIGHNIHFSTCIFPLYSYQQFLSILMLDLPKPYSIFICRYSIFDFYPCAILEQFVFCKSTRHTFCGGYIATIHELKMQMWGIRIS